jgi:hypothetical protein
VKAKTAFESGNSPPKVSESGAPIQTGHGLEETKRRIVAAFEKIRQHPVQHSEQTPQPQVELVYTEQHKTRFHQRAKRLSLAALESSCIMKAKARSNVFEISVPTESAEELIKEALGE